MDVLHCISAIGAVKTFRSLYQISPIRDSQRLCRIRAKILCFIFQDPYSIILHSSHLIFWVIIIWCYGMDLVLRIVLKYQRVRRARSLADKLLSQRALWLFFMTWARIQCPAVLHRNIRFDLDNKLKSISL